MSGDLTQLISQLDEDDAATRAGAVGQLCRLGELARPAAVALVEACGDPNESVREWATAALEGLGPPNDEDVASLTGLIRHQAADVAYWAVTLLGRAGAAAGQSAGELAGALRDHPAAAVRQRAAWALGKIGPPAAAALDELKTAAASDDPRLARLAKRAIEQVR
jgi:HEAT repeat protein